MKRREGGRRDRADGFPSQPFSSDDAFRTAHLHRLRILEPPPNERARQIHHLVVVSFFADWRGHWLGHVSILALKNASLAAGLIHMSRSKRVAGVVPSLFPMIHAVGAERPRQTGGPTSRR